MQHDRSNSARSPLRSSTAEDRRELERFRHDIDLVSFATSKGYAIDERESSRSCCMMRRSDGDKIAIGKAADGHWQYYSFRDDKDNGDIIQFVQNRAGGRAAYPLGAVRKELRGWTHTTRELPQRAARVVQPVVVDRDGVARGLAEAKVLDTHPYLETRGLARETLSSARFRGKWRVDAGRHGNILFPHHDAEGLSGCEVKNHGFTGFSSGGQKGLWCSLATPCDRRLVVTESAIDAMSYHQVNPHPKTRYVSLGGAQNPRQPALLAQAISWMPAGSVVVAATDNDKAGHGFAETVSDLCTKHPHVSFERHAPSLGKDWNDHLQALRSPARSLGRERNDHPSLDR
jgi:Toprim-like/Protein of unknown function (DUF3991)